MVGKRPLIVVDTRERTPWLFKGYPVRIRYAAMKTGDYRDARGRVLVERKTVSDLFHTLTRNEARFRREMARFASDHPLAFHCIVVEGTPTSVKYGTWSSAANGGRVLDHFLRVCVQYKVAPVFGETRLVSERVAYGLMTGGNQ